jgi:hypothetical protein
MDCRLASLGREERLRPRALALWQPCEGYVGTRDGKTNWALAAYVESFEDWRSELRAAVNWPISLVAIGPKFEMDDTVRTTGIALWQRD